MKLALDWFQCRTIRSMHLMIIFCAVHFQYPQSLDKMSVSVQFSRLLQAYQYHCMSPRHIKRAIEEFNIKIPKRLEEKEEKKPPPQYNCQVKICPVYCQLALKSCRSKSCHLQPESCRPKFLVTSKVLELGHIYSELSLLKVL